MPNPTPLKDLANFMNKQVVPCVQVKVTKAEAVEDKDGQHGPYKSQKGQFSDASGGSISFVLQGADHQFFKSSDVGQTFVISCGTDKNGSPSGIRFETWEYTGKTYTALKIGKAATIDPVEGQGPSYYQSATTQGGAVSVQSGPPPAKLPVRNRVHLYFEILAEVHAQRQNRSDLPDITPSDEKDIATHISMTYDNRENYQEPLLKKPSPKVEEPPDQGGVDPEADDLPFAPAWKSLGSGVF